MPPRWFTSSTNAFMQLKSTSATPTWISVGVTPTPSVPLVPGAVVAWFGALACELLPHAATRTTSAQATIGSRLAMAPPGDRIPGSFLQPLVTRATGEVPTQQLCHLSTDSGDERHNTLCQ